MKGHRFSFEDAVMIAAFILIFSVCFGGPLYLLWLLIMRLTD